MSHKQEKSEDRFAFGKNWKDYLDTQFNDIALAAAKKAITRFVGEDGLKGKTVVDVGCGSGIHSLAMLELGAASVLSVDIDTDSVDCSEHLRGKSPFTDTWQVKKVSLLSKEEMAAIGTFDMVYCWGVAHHTGEMYKAFDHLVDAVAPEGQLYIAIYNKVDGLFGSAHWHKIKKFYVRSAKPVKKIMEWGYVSYHFSRLLIRFKNPFTVMKSFYKKRGMSWKHDFIDWLGGFPYEYASLEQMFDYFCTKKGMKIENVKTTNYIGNNQLLLRK